MKATQSFNSESKFGAIKFFILLILTFLITTSCDLTDPKKDKPKPEGYQEDIPWPSLADSPWPMFMHDPQNTGRSKLEIPSNFTSIVNSIYCRNLLAGCVLGKDDFIFNSSNYSVLYSYNHLSLIKNYEKIIGSESLTAPLISKNNIYTSAQNIVYAFNINGDSLWSVAFNNTQFIYQRSLNIDRDGNIYVIANKTLYKINSDGKILNQLMINNIDLGFNTSAFSPDGKTLYVQGNTTSILAIDINTFSIKWTYGERENNIPPAVDCYGNIYLLLLDSDKRYCLVSLNEEGLLRWKFQHYENVEAGGYPIISKYGDIIFGFDTLYSVSYQGKLNWKKSFPSKISSITTDCAGNLLVGTSTKEVVFLDKNGIIKSGIKLQHYGNDLLPIIFTKDKIFAPVYKGGIIFVIK